MNCLLTGITGFVGAFLAESLLADGSIVHGTTRRRPTYPRLTDKGARLHQCDLRNPRRIRELIDEVHPDCVYHLAAQSFPTESWNDPATTFEVNLIGAVHLLDAIRSVGVDPVILVFGSAAEYAESGDGSPIREDHPREPSSPYALSKIAQDQLALLYRRAYGSRIIRVRPFFTIGPGKVGDVCSDLAREVVAVERGLQSTLRVGNLSAVRDFVDVRDAVRAYRLIAQRGAPGDVYNVCSGRGWTVRTVLEIFLELALKPIQISEDPMRLRLLDEPVKIGDCGKALALGWTPRILLQDTLADILGYWRREGEADRE